MESNKTVAERWLAAVGCGDTETVRELMTADAVWELMGTSVLAGERTVDEVTELVTSQLQGSALFASRFRENAARALLLTLETISLSASA